MELSRLENLVITQFGQLIMQLRKIWRVPTNQEEPCRAYYMVETQPRCRRVSWSHSFTKNNGTTPKVILAGSCHYFPLLIPIISPKESLVEE